LQCVRLHPDGRVATVYLKRRDLLRLFTLDPRDLRRIDPNLQFTRSSPTMYVKDNVLLVQLAGVRLIITAQTALVLDPHCDSARQFLSEIIPKLQVSAGQRLMQEFATQGDSRSSKRATGDDGAPAHIPFELDVLEIALHVAVAKLDVELERAQQRVQACLERLPRDITPQNLDDLRRAKTLLVELESKSDAHRHASTCRSPDLWMGSHRQHAYSNLLRCTSSAACQGSDVQRNIARSRQRRTSMIK
jgi:hypothetical protein